VAIAVEEGAVKVGRRICVGERSLLCLLEIDLSGITYFRRSERSFEVKNNKRASGRLI
jgi:hypothetical protein